MCLVVRVDTQHSCNWIHSSINKDGLLVCKAQDFVWLFCFRLCCLTNFFYIQVDRTKLRPIASGLLTPFQGIGFLGLQLLLGLGILLQLNNYRFVWIFYLP
jgi:hypothetical protein